MQSGIEQQLDEQAIKLLKLEDTFEVEIYKKFEIIIGLLNDFNEMENRINTLCSQLQLTQAFIKMTLSEEKRKEYLSYVNQLTFNTSCKEEEFKYAKQIQNYYFIELENLNRQFKLYLEKGKQFEDEKLLNIIQLGRMVLQCLPDQQNNYQNQLRQTQSEIQKLSKLTEKSLSQVEYINPKILQIDEQTTVMEKRVQILERSNQELELQQKNLFLNFSKQSNEVYSISNQMNQYYENISLKLTQQVEQQVQEKIQMQLVDYPNIQTQIQHLEQTFFRHINQCEQQFRQICYKLDKFENERDAKQLVTSEMKIKVPQTDSFSSQLLDDVQSLKQKIQEQQTTLEHLSSQQNQHRNCEQKIASLESTLTEIKQAMTLLQSKQDYSSSQGQKLEKDSQPQTSFPFQNQQNLNQNKGIPNNQFQQVQKLQENVAQFSQIQPLQRQGQNFASQPNFQKQITDFQNKGQSSLKFQMQSQLPNQNQIQSQQNPQNPQQQSSIIFKNAFPSQNNSQINISKHSGVNQFQQTLNQSKNQLGNQNFNTNKQNEQIQGSLNDQNNAEPKPQPSLQQYYEKEHPDKIRLQIVQENINKLYDQSCRKRSAKGDQQLFVKDKQNKQELYRNYGIRRMEEKNKLSKICNSFRQARGDGNCFYISFGLQFFQILLVNYSSGEFESFIEKMDRIITFQIKHGQGYEIKAKELQEQLWNELKYRLRFLREITEENLRIEQLTLQYASYEQNDEFKLIDGCFYGLSTIFFRNLANYVIDHSEMKQHVYDQENLLLWEVECNNNEIVIAELAKYLKVHVKLIFFDNGSFQLREYSTEMNHKIILLIQPGHYNSGYYEELQ